MSENRYLQGSDFTTLCVLHGRYATGNQVEIQDFDLRACTDIHVRVAKLNDAGEVQTLWDLSRYGEFMVLAGNILRIDWVGPKMPLGTFSLDFIAKYQGANIRMFTPTKLVFDIVLRSEDVNVPAESLIDSNTYLLEGDLLLMLTGSVQADWTQNDPSMPDYIKNRPEPVTAESVAEWGFGSYSKPNNGIPAADLSQAVQDLLTAAGSALQSDDIASLIDKVSALESLISEDSNPTAAIDKFNEIVAFLATITNTQSLAGIISGINDAIAAKQDALVSGKNIKTINNQSILGEGNIDIQEGGGGIAYPTFSIDSNGHLIMTDGSQGMFTLSNGHLYYNF